MPIYEYNFKGARPEQVCRGPVAQDWNAAFPCDGDERKIPSGDLMGVSLAGVKALAKENDAQAAQLSKQAEQITALEHRVEKQDELIAKLLKAVDVLTTEVAQLKK